MRLFHKLYIYIYCLYAYICNICLSIRAVYTSHTSMPELIYTCICICMCTGQYGLAIRYYEDPDNLVTYDAITYSLLVTAYGERDFERAWDLFIAVGYLKQAENKLNLRHICTTDTGVYNAILSVCNKHTRWREALSVMSYLLNEDLLSTSYTSSNTSGSSTSSGFIGRVSDTNTPVSIPPFTPIPSPSAMGVGAGRVRADIKSFSSAISCCGAALRWREVMALYGRIEKEG